MRANTTSYTKLTCLAVAVGSIAFLGCAVARLNSQPLPSASYLAPRETPLDTSVQLFQEGESPDRPAVPVARVAAHGNAYASRTLLEHTLTIAATKHDADFVIVTGSQITQDGSVGTYGGGIAISTPIRTPHLYGIAYRWGTASIGVRFNQKGEVEYVTRNSPAEKAGIKEGHKILAINGIFIRADQFVVAREISSKAPGEVVKIELLSPDGDKWITSVELGAPQALHTTED